MNQISSLEINGLKSYTELTQIPLTRLNVFSGINSVGKSTATTVVIEGKKYVSEEWVQASQGLVIRT